MFHAIAALSAPAAVLLLAATSSCQTLVGGTVSVPTTLTLAQSPYVVTSDLVCDATLTIEPGVVVRFQGGRALQVRFGALDAQGTPASPVTFTSNAASPAPGSWDGLDLTPPTTATPPATVLRHCVIEFGGPAFDAAVKLDARAGPITIDQVTVRDCAQDGVEILGGAPSLSGVSVENAGRHGVRLSGNNAGTMDQLAVVNPASYGVKIDAGGSPTLTNSTVENAIRFRNLASFTMQVSGNTFTNYDAFPNRAGAHMVAPFLNQNTIAGVVPGQSIIQVLGGDLTGSATWPDLGIVFRVTSTVTVAGTSGPTLTLDAGTTLRFGIAVALQIGDGAAAPGTLVAQGSALAPITLTRDGASNWSGLRFVQAGPGSVLQHVVAEFGGRAASVGTVSVTLSHVTVTDCTIRNSEDVGLRVFRSLAHVTGSDISDNATIGAQFLGPGQPGGTFQGNTLDNNGSFPLQVDTEILPALGGNLYTNNALQQVELVGGDVVDDVTLPDEGVPYVVTDDLTVFGSGPGATIFEPPDVATLTLEAGTTLRFRLVRDLTLGSGGGAGVLRALGTASAPVTLTSNAGSPAPGDWRGVVFTNSTSESLLRHTVIEFAGASGQSINAASGALRVERCTIRDGSGRGFRIATGGAPGMTGSTVTGHTVGIDVLNAGFGTFLVNSDLSGNGTGVAGPSVGPLAARGNWWGDASGPSGAGPGSGVPVTGSVGFEPWLNGPPTSMPGWTGVLVSPRSFPVPGGGTHFSASFDEAVSWTVTIRDASNAVVRTFSGSGTGLSQAWAGDDATQTPLPDGTYTYEIGGTSVATGQPLPSAVGAVQIMAASPVALITAPGHDEVVLPHSTFTVTGTASQSYTLHMGSGPALQGRVLIGNGGAVTNGTLGTFDPLSFSRGLHTLQLVVGSGAGQVVLVRPFVLDHLEVTDVSASPNVIDPSQSETTLVGYTLSAAADSVTIKVISYPGSSQITSFPGPGQSGSNMVAWDGSAGASTVADGAYRFVVEASNTLGQTGVFDDPTVFGASAGGSIVGTSGFDPHRNDVLTVEFVQGLFPFVADVEVRSGTQTLRTLAVQGDAGTHPVRWDGRRDDGTLHVGPFSIFNVDPVVLPPWAVLIDVARPEILDFRAEAWVIKLRHREVSTFTYTLSRAATVTVTITDPNGSTVRTLVSGLPQAAGAQTLEWDGTDDQGLLVGIEGDYRVEVVATDAVTGRQGTWCGTVVVYR